MRVMVDMSATLLHHGHIRILRKAKEIGTHLTVALTSDEEILLKKGYTPELKYGERAEILLAIKYVDEVVKSPWLLDDDFLNKHEIDLLVHGDDNANDVSEKKIKIFKRTKEISSHELRRRAKRNFETIINRL